MGIYSYAPAVGVDSSGNVGIAWRALTASLLYPGGHDIFFCQSSDSGKTFSPAINISDNIGQIAANPFTLTSPSGQMNVLWEDETGGNNQLYGLAFGEGTSGPPQQVTPPSNLLVTPSEAGQITLSWTVSPEATSYIVRRRRESEAEFTIIAIGVTTNSFVDADVLAGESYAYSVIAINANQQSSASNVASAAPAAGSGTPADKILMLPTTARSQGATGSFFTTDVWISNGSDANVTLQAEFLRAGGQDNSSPPKTSLVVNAHQSRVVNNILGSLFGVQDNWFGPIRFSVPGSAADRIAIVSRTSTPSTDGTPGTYGLSVEARDVSTGSTAPICLTGLTQNTAFRSNVGIINLTGNPAPYGLALLNSTGATLATASSSLAPFAAAQSSLTSLFPSAVTPSSNLDGLTVIVTPSNEALMAYATPVDNSTGDGAFISGIPFQSGLMGGTHYVPVVTRSSGAFGTHWSSRLAVFNPGSEAISLSFSLHVPKADNHDVIPVRKTLGAKATLLFSDVLLELLQKDSGYGALQVDWIAPSGLAPVFSSQTATPAGNKPGTYGLQVDPVTLRRATRTQQLPGVRQDDGFRTNIGFVNPTTETVSVSCTLRLADGSSRGNALLTMRPLDYFQVGFNGLFAPSPKPGNGEVMTVEVTSSAPIFLYGSLIDNASQDPTYLIGQ